MQSLWEYWERVKDERAIDVELSNVTGKPRIWTTNALLVINAG